MCLTIFSPESDPEGLVDQQQYATCNCTKHSTPRLCNVSMDLQGTLQSTDGANCPGAFKLRAAPVELCATCRRYKNLVHKMLK